MLPQRWFGVRPEALLPRLLLVLVIVLVIRRWVWAPILMEGESMLPTLTSGRLALVNKLAYRFRPPQRGDIVLVWTGEEWWVKRILGLPGEEIAVRSGAVYVNGSPIQEPYVRLKDFSDIARGKLETGRFVVAGDNRQSGLIAVVSRDRVVGKLMFLRTRTQRPH